MTREVSSSASAVGSGRRDVRRSPLCRSTLKTVAIGYAVKTLLVGLAWAVVPDLPERVVTTVRGAWQWAAASGR